MKFKTSASLMIAVVLGLITAYVGIDVLKKAKGGAARGAKVVVVARDMEPGYVVELSDLKLQEVPASLVPSGALKELKSATGRTVVMSVAKGAALLDNQLAAPGSGAGMQAMVPKGMRAVAVEVSEGSAVAGLITPGCRVDVIGTFNRGDQQIATTVVQNVKVQFVQRSRPTRSSANSASPDALGPVKTVTLLVTPKQANAIELANNQGRPRLVLRGNADETDNADSTMALNELLGIPDEPETEPIVVKEPPTDAFADPEPEPRRRTVEIIRGGKAEQLPMDLEEGEDAEEEEGNGAAPAAPQQQPRKRTQTAGDSDTDPRTASGASPGAQAPRREAGRGNLRKGM